MYERFGSKKGFFLYLKHGLLTMAGNYRKFSVTLPEKGRRLVFICSGNICRSPLAEVYAASLGWEAASCGLHCRDDYPADPRAISFALKQGLDLESHKTIHVNRFRFDENDLIVVMEPAHIVEFQRAVGKDYQIALAGKFCKPANPYIHDPFNCCPEYFQLCEQKVMESVRGLCGTA
tara:strand:+ start:17531 stop:18061 length:531 start_codon:yes stop_codon:yes gene_type:complete